eukprot:m51a1_g13089 hypothetical protein (212) ;mRNA; r:3143-3996
MSCWPGGRRHDEDEDEDDDDEGAYVSGECGAEFGSPQGLNGHKAHCWPGRKGSQGLSGHKAHCKVQASPQEPRRRARGGGNNGRPDEEGESWSSSDRDDDSSSMDEGRDDSDSSERRATCPACCKVFGTPQAIGGHWGHCKSEPCGHAGATHPHSAPSGFGSQRFSLEWTETAATGSALVRSSFRPSGNCEDESRALFGFIRRGAHVPLMI